MSVPFKTRARMKVEVPLISLIDIVFLLLIYFLLTTNFLVDEEIKINLPQAKASTPQIEKDITVHINREGKAFLGNKEISLASLFDRLKEMIGNDTDRLVLVKADRAVILNKVVKVMDVVKAAGAGRLCLATEKEF